jgi:hypothetical protein
MPVSLGKKYANGKKRKGETMKRILAPLAVLVILFTAAVAYTASSVLETTDTIILNNGNKITELTIAWTDDDNASGGGSFDDYTILRNVEGKHFMAVVDPGTKAPTILYDIQLLDENGVDIYGGNLVDSDNVTTSNKLPMIGSDNVTSRPVLGTLTIDIDNQSVDSANGTIVLYIEQ